MKVRAFCFTINNYTPDDIKFLEEIKCEYIVYGFEVAPTTGTPHIQGYVYFKNARSVKTSHKFLRGNIEPAKGNAESNKIYCSKDGNFVERGNMPKQGKRNDIDVVRDIIKDGGSMQDVLDEARSFQAVRFAEKYKEYNEPKRYWKTKVYWFYGPTGSGKTRRAFDMFPDAWVSGKNLKWWQGYDAHEDVIIDDFRCDFCTFHELLRILDRYPYTVEVKGGSRQLLAKNIVITCPLEPHAMFYHRSDEDIQQVIRRIDVVEYFGTDVSGTEVGGNNRPLLCVNPGDVM